MRGDQVVRTLDLFCGGGGSSWGARAAGADIVCGIDAWNVAAKTYGANFGDAAGVNLTLKETGRLPLLSRLHDIDLILASPECRSHTCAKGSRQGDDDSRRTARYVLRFAGRLKPRWIVIENVVHMRNWDGFAESDRGSGVAWIPRPGPGPGRVELRCSPEASSPLSDLRSRDDA